MTKTESAEHLIKTLVIESCEQLLEFHAGGGVRLAIPNTNNLIMVGPQEWIAKNVPGVEAMVAGEQPTIGKLLDEFSALPVLWGLNEPGALMRHSDVFKMLVNAGKTYLAATTQASTAQAERDRLRAALRDVLHSLQFINDTPGGAIQDTLWMMHGLAPETVFDFIDATLEPAAGSTDAQAAAEVRDAALEEAADALELLNDPAGDAAAYDNRDMDMYEEERMHAIQHCINTIRALRAGDTGEQADGGAA